nr:ankyrin repeat domain [Pandoravirus belohorizontensis]
MHCRGVTPPVLFSNSMALDADAAPIGILPREMIAHVITHLGTDREGDLSVCMCILASRIFHVVDRQTLWQRGARLRRRSLVPDRLAQLGIVPVLCRLFRRRALTSRALVEAARHGQTGAVRFLCEVARLTERTVDAMTAAIEAAHAPVVAYLLTRVPTDASLVDALVAGAFSKALFTPAHSVSSDRVGFLTAKWHVARLVCQAVQRFPLGDTSLYARSATACALLSRADGALDWLCGAGALDPSAALQCAIDSGDPALADRAADLMRGVPPDPEGTPRRIVERTSSSLVLPIIRWRARHESILCTDWKAVAMNAVRHRRYDVLDFVMQHARDKIYDSHAADAAAHRSGGGEGRLADHWLRPHDSLAALERAMATGDHTEAAAVCARRSALGLPCKVGHIYYPTVYAYPTPAQRAEHKRSCARAFDLSMAQAVGIDVCGTANCATAAADMGAAATLDWVLTHTDVKRQVCIGGHGLGPDLIDVLMKHGCLDRPFATFAHLVRGRHWDRAARLCEAYPHIAPRAAEASLDDAVRAADLALAETVARTTGTAIGVREMNMAASYAPLEFVADLARHWGARCTAQGIMGAMRRLHGAVLAALLDDESGLCTPDALDVSTAARKQTWKKAIASAAAAGFVENAERMRKRLGLPTYGTRAMNGAAAQNNLAALAALHALGARFTSRAFTRAVGGGHIEAVDFLLSARSVAPSTYALVMAIQRGHLAIVRRLLLARGCPYSHAALIEAARYRRAGIIPLLLARHPPSRRTLAKAVRAARDGLETTAQDNQPDPAPVIRILLGHRC